ncbi:MAG TPA: hypothetical protein VL091_15020 [Marinobacter sp.]|nr:hypothetical protein [Marinobacter sp.]
MDYGASVQKVLLRKIRKAEQDLAQLKLDYCRFVFGLSHRVRIISDGKVYIVCSVDVESMKNTEEDTFSRPAVTATPADQPNYQAPVSLGTEWVLEAASGQAIR